MDSTIEIRPAAQDPCTFPPAASQPPFISVNIQHRICFRHPHYPDSNNTLITLFAPDIPAGGIEYGVAHAACGVISGNRWDGWFTTTVNGERSNLTYGDVLYERKYYFHLPGSSLKDPYAIVPTFREWTFPHENLHPCWQTSQDNIPLAQNTFPAASALSTTVYHRDRSCRMSNFKEGIETAYLCPRKEYEWFQLNEIDKYSLNTLLALSKLLEDTTNCLTLREDLHTQFDARKFVFVPKKRKGNENEDIPIVTHLLCASQELGLLHHNVRLQAIPEVHIAFLFARFAWAIFPSVARFLQKGVDRTLIGTTISTTPGISQALTGADCRKFFVESTSRSQSPSKRTRIESNTEVDCAEDESGLPSKRRKKDEEIGVLRDTWLKRERLRSNPDKTQMKEESWYDRTSAWRWKLDRPQASLKFLGCEEIKSISSEGGEEEGGDAAE